MMAKELLSFSHNVTLKLTGQVFHSSTYLFIIQARAFTLQGQGLYTAMAASREAAQL
jgi:hypothetical protein